jgi:hypothetical protein
MIHKVDGFAVLNYPSSGNELGINEDSGLLLGI